MNNVKHVYKMGPLHKKQQNIGQVYPSETDDPDQPKHSQQNVFCIWEESWAHDN